MLPDVNFYLFLIAAMAVSFLMGAFVGSFWGQTKAYEKGFRAGKAVQKAMNGYR
jgi:hypothetical protein